MQEHSHLYATDGRMVGTFQRIDIPILREFDQYHYVLFTGEAAANASGQGLHAGTPLSTPRTRSPSVL